jgi:hypothetical protein
VKLSKFFPRAGGAQDSVIHNASAGKKTLGSPIAVFPLFSLSELFLFFFFFLEVHRGDEGSSQVSELYLLLEA